MEFNTESDENKKSYFRENKEVKSKLEKDIEDVRNEMNEMQEDYKKFQKEQQFKILEFLGIFSGILSFILITSNIMINNKLDVLSIVLLLIGFSLSLMIFITGIKFIVIESDFKWHFIFTIFTIITFSALIFFNFKDTTDINSEKESKIQVNTIQSNNK